MFWIYFVIFLAACFAAGSTGGLFPPGKWYVSLEKPSWTPPNWMFPVAWSVLYICIAVAGARAAMAPDSGLAMAFWSLQIALNTLWTPVFFGLRRMRLGLAVMAVLWLAVACGMVTLWMVDWIAGLLFLPYLAWVSVAFALNLTIVRLNPRQHAGEPEADFSED